MFVIQSTTITSSSFIGTPSRPIFLHLVLPFKWFNNDDNGMSQCLLVFSWKSPFFSLHPWPLLVLHLSINGSRAYKALIVLFLIFVLLVLQGEGVYFLCSCMLGSMSNNCHSFFLRCTLNIVLHQILLALAFKRWGLHIQGPQEIFLCP